MSRAPRAGSLDPRSALQPGPFGRLPLAIPGPDRPPREGTRPGDRAGVSKRRLRPAQGPGGMFRLAPCMVAACVRDDRSGASRRPSHWSIDRARQPWNRPEGDDDHGARPRAHMPSQCRTGRTTFDWRITIDDCTKKLHRPPARAAASEIPFRYLITYPTKQQSRQALRPQIPRSQLRASGIDVLG
jgi:hypothetical protein